VIQIWQSDIKYLIRYIASLFLNIRDSVITTCVFAHTFVRVFVNEIKSLPQVFTAKLCFIHHNNFKFSVKIIPQKEVLHKKNLINQQKHRVRAIARETDII
jgi:hypothetical protein